MDAVSGDGTLSVFLPPETVRQMDGWRRVYLEQFLEIPPHITVVYPPFIRVENWPSLRLALLECLQQFQPFDVTLKEWGMFTDSPYILWLKPEDSGNLSTIHATLTQRFPHHVPRGCFGYVPHVTVGVFDSPEALFQVRENVPPEIPPLHFRVEELSYTVLGDNDEWQVHDRLPFGIPLANT